MLLNVHVDVISHFHADECIVNVGDSAAEPAIGHNFVAFFQCLQGVNILKLTLVSGMPGKRPQETGLYVTFSCLHIHTYPRCFVVFAVGIISRTAFLVFCDVEYIE